MRKPRDIDAELQALVRRAKALNSRKITQWGELIIAVSADELDAETLVGIVREAIQISSPGRVEAWRRIGADFFQRAAPGHVASEPARHSTTTEKDACPDPPRPSGSGQD